MRWPFLKHLHTPAQANSKAVACLPTGACYPQRSLACQKSKDIKERCEYSLPLSSTGQAKQQTMDPGQGVCGMG